MSRMLTVEDYGRIRRAHRDGMSIREIARKFRHSRYKVREVLQGSSEPQKYSRRETQIFPKLALVLDRIREILTVDESAPPKQRHTAMRLFERLRAEHGYKGGYDTVRQLTDLMSGPDLHVSIAFTRGEAIELSLQNSFDLALIAHGLVDGNGQSLFADVLHQRGRSRGVLLSRHADLRVIMAAIGAGFSHVISYPIDSAQIRRILMELLPDLQEQCNCYDYQSERKVQMNIEGYAPDLKSIASLSMSAIRHSHSTC